MDSLKAVIQWIANVGAIMAIGAMIMNQINMHEIREARLDVKHSNELLDKTVWERDLYREQLDWIPKESCKK